MDFSGTDMIMVTTLIIIRQTDRPRLTNYAGTIVLPAWMHGPHPS